MQTYFIHDGKAQVGPFSAAQLMERNITSCTPVKTTGSTVYTVAADIPELKELLQTRPAPALVKEKPFITKPAWLAALAFVIVGAVAFYYLFPNDVEEDHSFTAAAQANTTHMNLLASNPANAQQFLSLDGKMHSNLIGKKIIKGTITNTATNQKYKDLQIAVTFLSANKSELQTQRIFVNDSVSNHNSISFRNVLKAPDETVGFSMKILSATLIQ